jgi:hypothetical protein
MARPAKWQFRSTGLPGHQQLRGDQINVPSNQEVAWALVQPQPAAGHTSNPAVRRGGDSFETFPQLSTA